MRKKVLQKKQAADCFVLQYAANSRVLDGMTLACYSANIHYLYNLAQRGACTCI